jgi:cell division septum initiation protein DivIVA
MPKKDKKASKKDKGREPADVVEAVRGAVERTFQATTGGTEGARDRGRSLLDDVASAAQRIRESFDDLRVLEDVRGLRAEIEALGKRVAELEKKQAAPAAAPAATAKPAPARRTPAKRTPAAKKPAAPAKAPAKPSAASTAAKTTGPKAKPATTTRRKPAASRNPPSGGGS